MTQAKINTNLDATELINQIFMVAIDDGASDIHIEPNDNGMSIRLRIDGILRKIADIKPATVSHLAAKIKIMAQLDITGLPRPQEGNIKFPYDNRSVDFRVSIFPTSYGECFVLRILESIKIYDKFEKLGYESEQARLIESAIRKPFGLILVTGPTGSGKSTTLFTILDKLNREDISIVTLEDPVERNMQLIRQTQINPEIGLTFASGLRYLLRQDPNIIMVGEIRDKETAQIAVHAAIMGQLVLATIHTNNAAGAIVRLLNMKIEPFLLASSLRLVTAQRLARMNCPDCREEHELSPEMKKRINAGRDMKFYRSFGCEHCQNKGVIGRFGIHEVLPVIDEVEKAIFENPSDYYITNLAQKKGMRTLREVALEKATKGLISVEEVLRITDI